ncbi:hypothetical protein [Variovorax saccharolyticus]|uniref:hypothetical protein n=1 Tax=Variovorax saccharolyticus TaxID=3053516 RepID=UPI0025760218|nr:hypothetical protein [Variovorax sp. J31P216]MDM0026793.1 hypothetical protein [Variovorax sp. J31P216]
MTRPRLAALALAVASVLAGCSPTFNWREVPIGKDGVVALLPCKPDRATRALPLGAEAVTVDMAGCETGGATFAVAHAVAGSPLQAEGWIRAWRAATRSQLAGAPATEAAAVLPRAAATPAPVRLDTPEAEGAAATKALHVLWFAQQRPDGVSLYQATVIGKPSSADALPTFFEGLRVP